MGLIGLIVAFAVMPSVAMGAACSSADTSYNGNRESTSAVPNRAQLCEATHWAHGRAACERDENHPGMILWQLTVTPR